jgi:phosphoribosylglycinamide formyltransferase-1
MSSGSEDPSADRPARVALFASGRGSNVRAIVERFAREGDVAVALVLANKADAPVLDFARERGIPVHVTDRDEFRSAESVFPVLREHGVDWIALAGFLWLVPEGLIKAFPGRIVNIHPALLPKYGGKGMYGMRVHEAVRAAGDPVSGITIHFVDPEYDHGEPIFRAEVALEPGDSAQAIAAKVLRLEHAHYPEVLLLLMRGLPVRS